MALISVIVPVYNVENYLQDCLDSLCGQTLRDIEIICVNDGSTDSSADIVANYAQKDPRIKIINQKNGGLSHARNSGLAVCTAPYVMFCDSDDLMKADMCEKMYQHINQNDADMAACEIDVAYHGSDNLKPGDDAYFSLRHKGLETNPTKLLNSLDVCVVNKIFKKELIETHKINFPEGYNFEDNFFFWSYISVARSCAFVNEKLYIYNRRENSIMDMAFKKNSSILGQLLIAEKIFDFLHEKDLLIGLKKEFAIFYIRSFYFVQRFLPIKNWPQFYSLNHRLLHKFSKSVSMERWLHNLNLRTQIKWRLKKIHAPEMDY